MQTTPTPHAAAQVWALQEAGDGLLEQVLGKWQGARK
jgi:hypothetical protein